jgi:hypothetical protein
MTLLMNIQIRYKLGVFLVVVSILAAVGLFVADLYLSHPRTIGAGGDSNGYWIASTWKSVIGGWYLIPILFGAVGMLCLVWPRRKPPKLHE